MPINIKGNFYDDIIHQVVRAEVVDISKGNYEAKTFKSALQLKEEQHPFILCHHEEITLRVESWFGEEITWTFLPGERPILLKRLIKHADNTIETGIQIGY